MLWLWYYVAFLCKLLPAQWVLAREMDGASVTWWRCFAVLQAARHGVKLLLAFVFVGGSRAGRQLAEGGCTLQAWMVASVALLEGEVNGLRT